MMLRYLLQFSFIGHTHMYADLKVIRPMLVAVTEDFFIDRVSNRRRLLDPKEGLKCYLE